MVFLDYASTNPHPKYRCSDYGPFMNVNANYAYKEKRLLKECEDRVKAAIGAKGGKVVFGGTSSQLIENLYNHIYDETNKHQTICSIYEHDSVWRFSNQRGDIDGLRHVIQTYHGGKQLIVCLMGVNNITGEIMPVEEIGKMCHKHDAFYICDATAMIGHAVIPDNIDDWCDCLVMSGHKIGTELGIGAMWVSDKLDEWLNSFELHGTPNLAGALAITRAVEVACDKQRIITNTIRHDDLLEKLCNMLYKHNIKNTFIPFDVSDYDGYTPSISAICLPGINADSLQQYLASKQIYVGVGHSSCSDNSDFRVLEAYGLTKQEASEVIRVSFGDDSSIEDVKALINGIMEYKKLYC